MDRPRDGTTEDLLALVGVAAAGGMIWWLAGDHILAAAVAASAVLSMPAALLADIAGPVELPFISEWLLRPSQAARDLLFAVPFAALSEHGHALTAGGRNAALFALPLLFLAARAVAGLRPDIAYRTRHTLESATREQAKVWPTALRALERNLADDSEPETEVDPERMQLIRRAHEYCHIMGGGVGVSLPDMDPPKGAPDRVPDVDRAVVLAGQARWAEVAAMLTDAGWTLSQGEGCWHSRFEALLAAERWEEARLACFMAGQQQQPPATGSFLLPPLPDIPEPPPLGRALRPEEWCDARCLRSENGDCNPLAVEICLAEQLTRHFTALEMLRPHERALVACVAEFRANDSTRADRHAGRVDGPVLQAGRRRPGSGGTRGPVRPDRGGAPDPRRDDDRPGSRPCLGRDRPARNLESREAGLRDPAARGGGLAEGGGQDHLVHDPVRRRQRGDRGGGGARPSPG